MNISNTLTGCAISLAVGGGIYGLYFKNLTPAAITQAESIELARKCYEYNSQSQFIPKRIKEIEDFIEKVELKQNDIFKSDAISTVIVSVGEKKYTQAGIGISLRTCMQELKKNVDKINKL